MKGRLIALDMLAGRKAAAMLEDGVLTDLLLDPADDSAPRPGTIFRAICDRPMKGQGGMMLRLPRGTAYLRRAKGLRPGQALLVQATGWAEEGKAVPVTERLLFKSRYAIVTPGAPGINLSRQIRDEEARMRLLEIAHAVMEASDDGTGLILRSAAEEADAEAVAADMEAMRDLTRKVLQEAGGDTPEALLEGPDAHLLAWRDWPRPDLFAETPGCFVEYGLDDMISTILAPKQPLKGGGFALIEPTRAFVAVDVNTGADTSPAAGLKANIALARDLPRLLRCRGLGGQIVIDFAPMPRKERRQVEQALRAAFRRDGIETSLAGWTTLGNFELQRKRERLPLDELVP